MVKYNFIGKKNSGKSLSCFVLANLFSETKKTIILNFDYFSKYVDDKKKIMNKKINIKKNLELINVDVLNKQKKECFETEINKLFDQLKKTYEIILVDHPISFSKMNLFLLNNSSFIICPFKIDQEILEYKEKLINNLIKSNIYFKKFKFLPILCDTNHINATKMLNLRKQLNSLMFENYISHHEFKNYFELIENNKLIEEYKQIYKNITQI